MADVDTHIIVQRWKAELAELVPASLSPGAGRVPVFYSNPGDRWAGPDAVWFDDFVDNYEVRAMRATNRRHQTRSTFEVVVQVLMAGGSDPEREASLQYECDVHAADIRRAIIDHVSSEQHLSCPDLIDVAYIVDVRTARGFTDTGVGTRHVIRVGFDARPLGGSS